MRRHRIAPFLVAAALVTGVASIAAGGSSEESRHPYDPACAWGRVSNGRGILVRCLTRAEGEALAVKPAPAQSAKPPEPKPSATGAEKKKPPTDKKQPAPPNEPSSKSKPKKATSVLKAVHVENGTLPKAKARLSKAVTRFNDCVAKHGGMSDGSGSVHVRFMVRERGIAEGVQVAKRRGISKEAANCVAHVVERRSVGLPSAPILAATAVIEFTAITSKKSQ